MNRTVEKSFHEWNNGCVTELCAWSEYNGLFRLKKMGVTECNQSGRLWARSY